MHTIITFSLIFAATFGIGLFFSQPSGQDWQNDDSKSEISPSKGSSLLAQTRLFQDPQDALPSYYVTGRKEVIDSEGDTIYEDFVVDPYPIVLSSPNHSWTAVNAIATEDVDKLVHNDAERHDTLEKTTYTARRQLVYQKIAVQDLAEASLAQGEELTTVLLPGFDGEEFEISVLSWDATNEEGESRGGHLYGHLTNDPDSQVAWGYSEGVESGSIISPKNGLYLDYSGREEGQVVVDEIDLDALGIYEDEFNQESQQCGNKFDHLTVGNPLADFTHFDALKNQ